jgi:hypothetical protein
MSEFESKLLRLIALGILTLGSVGFCIVDPAIYGSVFAHVPPRLLQSVFVVVALICMAVIAGGLLPGFAMRLWNALIHADWRTEHERSRAGKQA